ncbi:MAG: ABC transporter permease [Acutalibacteraceae bacterium]|nr:ABC transporter permease [Acutalibacteraceae bacterium]
MFNQIKAEAYKLIKNKSTYITLIVCCVMFLLVLLMGNANSTGGFYMGQYIDFVDDVPVMNGFLGFIYEDRDNPMMWEIIYSAMTFSGFLWIPLLAISTSFYLNEYKNNTMRLFVAYGKNQFTMLISKLIVIVFYYAVIYMFFCLAALFYVSAQMDFSITSETLLYTLKFICLNYLMYIVLTFYLFFLCILIKNNIIVLTIMIIYGFSQILLTMATLGRENIFLNLYNHLNPIYYVYIAGSFWADSSVTINILLFFICAITIVSSASYILLKKQELK